MDIHRRRPVPRMRRSKLSGRKKMEAVRMKPEITVYPNGFKVKCKKRDLHSAAKIIQNVYGGYAAWHDHILYPYWVYHTWKQKKREQRWLERKLIKSPIVLTTPRQPPQLPKTNKYHTHGTARQGILIMKRWNKNETSRRSYWVCFSSRKRQTRRNCRLVQRRTRS